MARILQILILAFFCFSRALFADSADENQKSYDSLFQSGLKSEAARQYSEAIQYYLLAQTKLPSSPWPKERIASIFKEVQKAGQPSATLETLLPLELSQEFRKKGIIQDHYDSDAAVSKLNYYIWGAVLLVLSSAAAFLYYISIRAKRLQREEEALRASMFAKKPAPKAKASETAKEAGSQKEIIGKDTGAFKKDVKITDKMRNEMEGIFSNVKSLSEDNMPKTDTGSIDVEALKESGVIAAFAQSLVSEVSTEDAKDGRFSKMTVEASLLFDEDEGSAK